MNSVRDNSIPDSGAPRTFASPPAGNAPRDSLHTRLARWAIELPRSTKRLLMVAVDALMLPVALWTAMDLRRGELVDPAGQATAFVLAVACGLALFWLVGLYRSVTRFIGVRVIGRIAAAAMLCTLALTLLDSTAASWHVRYSSLAIFCAFVVLLVGSSSPLLGDR